MGCDIIEQGSVTYGPLAGSGPPSKIIRLTLLLQLAVTVWPAIMFCEPVLLANSCVV